MEAVESFVYNAVWVAMALFQGLDCAAYTLISPDSKYGRLRRDILLWARDGKSFLGRVWEWSLIHLAFISGAWMLGWKSVVVALAISLVLYWGSIYSYRSVPLPKVVGS